MSRQYELLYVLNPSFGDEALDAANERIQNLIADNGELLDVDVWGRKRLAYEIDDQKEGYYVLVHFNSEPEFPSEIERVLKISDYVLRYMVTKVEA